MSSADPLTHHFDAPPPAGSQEKITAPTARFNRQFQAHIDAVTHVARSHSQLVPVGMTIGPFSLTTKLLADPLSPVFLAGSGIGPDEDESVALMLSLHELAQAMVLRNVEAQAKAGAKAILVAEPAANRVFIAPRQVEEGSDIWERLVMEPNRRLRNLLDQHGVDLIFHCCGELEPWMVRDFTTLQPVILSLGSSRRLWEDAGIVPKDIVLYGNLPTKNFYSDEVVPDTKVVELSRELHRKMRDAGHPFILGSECDVLSVRGKEATIRGKVDLFMTCNLD
jgi:uroporphyrinogen-III decarboxylase